MHASLRWKIPALLVLLVLVLAACGVSEAPAVDPEAKDRDTIESVDGTKEGSEKDPLDEEKDVDGTKDEGDERIPGEPDEAMLECAYLADLEGLDGWLGEGGSAADAPWTLKGVDVELHHTDGVDTVAWSVPEGADVRVTAVKVYGGANPHTYLYLDGESRADDGLVAEPWGKEQEPAEITHVIVCVTVPAPDGTPEFEPTLEKTAQANLAVDWDWTLDKQVVHDTEAGTLAYDLGIAASPSIAASVEGIVTITNPADLAMTVASIGDRLYAGDAEASVDLACTLDDAPFAEGDTIPAGDSVVCSYEHDLDEPLVGTNKVAVHYAYEVDGKMHDGILKAAADFAFDGVDAVARDATAHLDDELTHLFGSEEVVLELPTGVSAEFVAELGGANTWEETYVVELPAELTCGEHVFTNDAALTNDEGDLLDEASATATVTVECAVTGCTRTQGYWTTHSSYEEPDRDPTWDELADGEDTLFFDGGLTYHEVLQESSDDGWYLILGRQYAAAQLNLLAGASMSVEVEEAYETAADLLTGASIDDEAPEDWETAKNVLDGYNNGAYDAPHCDGTA